MKLNVNTKLLFAEVRRMKAELVDFAINNVLPPLDPIDHELHIGITISLDNIAFNNGGLAEFYGRQVILYIKDQGKKINDALLNPENATKFHIADCQTLKNMRAKGRFDRYIVTNDLSGTFEIAGIDELTFKEIKGRAKLNVCKNCLSYLNYQGYQTYPKRSQEQMKIFNNFDIQEFFDTYSSFFTKLPSGIAENRSVDYTTDWKDISTRYRIVRNYCCEQCGVNLNTAKKLLHVHHKNGIKSDNRFANLIALCLDCHRKQDFHDHMFIQYKDFQTINNLRFEQGILNVTSWADVYKYADKTLHGLVDLLEKANKPLPSLNVELKNIIAPHYENIILDLAWTNKKVGIGIDPNLQNIAQKKWKLFTPKKCLDNTDKFLSLL